MSPPVPDSEIVAARNYEALYVPALFQPWSRHLIDAAGITAGARVLDVACGTGVLTRSALRETGPTGRVVGVDIAPGMLAAAKEMATDIEWLLCGAEDLAVENDAFDCVVSQFGMMFFADRDRAAREMWRVLRPGGSLALAIWRSVDHNPVYADIIELLRVNVSDAAADALRLPFSLGNAHEVTNVLENAGFRDITVKAATEQACFPSARQLVEAELRGWLPMFDILLDEATITELLSRSERLLDRYATAGGEAVFTTAAHVFSARKS